MTFCLYFIMKLYTMCPNKLYTMLPDYTVLDGPFPPQLHQRFAQHPFGDRRAGACPRRYRALNNYKLQMSGTYSVTVGAD